jgi:hypothetical protein
MIPAVVPGSPRRRGERMANPAGAVSPCRRVLNPGKGFFAVGGHGPREDLTHAVIRKYTASLAVAADARPKLAHLEQTMRQTPGFVAYYFLETDDGIATITITEDATGTQESMSRAANWVQQNLPNSGLGAPEVIRGEALINATR